MTFKEMGLCPEILTALAEAGYETPTPIQAEAIPILLTGKDLMGCAQTGTGKTAAFTLPILDRFRDAEPGHIRAVILTPTRELAIQVGRNIRTYSAHLKLRSTAVYGGVPIEPQELALRQGVDLLVATPGRLKDHMWRGNIDYRDTSVLVLDEADRMLDMGFIDDVREIVDMIPTDRQTMLFSATLAPEIVKLARDILRDPVRVEVARPSSTAEGVDQQIIRVSHGEKKQALEQALHDHERDRTLVFTRTRRGASSLASWLKGRGFRCTSIHSDKSQFERVAALEAFREGRIRILVATDIAARGLDVDGISHVINFDLPHSADDYVHRIGRTARAGNKGTAITIVTPEDLKGLAAIERSIGHAFLEPGEADAAAPAVKRSRGGSRRGGAGSSRSGGHSRSSGPQRTGTDSARPRRAEEPGDRSTRDVRMPVTVSSSTGASNGSATGEGTPAPKKRRRSRRRRTDGPTVGGREAIAGVNPKNGAGTAARKNGTTGEPTPVGFLSRMLQRLGMRAD